MSNQLDTEFAAALANVRVALQRDKEEIHHKVVHCEAVIGSRVSALQITAQVFYSSGAGNSAPSDQNGAFEVDSASPTGFKGANTDPQRRSRQ